MKKDGLFRPVRFQMVYPNNTAFYEVNLPVILTRPDVDFSRFECP